MLPQIQKQTGETVFDRVRRRSTEKQKNTRTGIIPHRDEIGFSEQKEELKDRFARFFFGFLTEKLFPDKQYAPSYKVQCINLIKDNYFSNQNTIKTIEWKFSELKQRVLIAQNWIAGFESPQGKKFDTELFFPKAFLENSSSINFQATERMLKTSRKWKVLNAYNRQLGDNKLTRHMNSIARKVERGEMYYQTGLEKVRLLTSDTDAYIKLFVFRITGKYQKI